MWSAISSVLSVSSFILSLAAIFFAVRNATRGRELQAMLRPLPMSRLQSVETSQAEMLVELQALANSLKMQKVRAAANHTNGRSRDPDPYTQPDEWRKVTNQKLAAQKHNLGG